MHAHKATDAALFRFLFVYCEPCLELLAGFYALLWPALFLRALTPWSAEPASPAALFVAREFGMMSLAFATIQYGMLRSAAPPDLRRFLFLLLPGDLLHAALTSAHLFGGGALDAAALFNLALSMVTPPLRIYYVISRRGQTKAGG